MAVWHLAPSCSALGYLCELKLAEYLTELSVFTEKWIFWPFLWPFFFLSRPISLRTQQCAVSEASQLDKRSTDLIFPKSGWQDPTMSRCSASTSWIAGVLKVVNRVITLQWTPRSLWIGSVFHPLHGSDPGAGWFISGDWPEHAAAAHVLSFCGSSCVSSRVLSSLQKHWCEFHLAAASLLSLLNPHLEDLAFPLNLLCPVSQEQEIPKTKLDQQVIVC